MCFVLSVCDIGCCDCCWQDRYTNLGLLPGLVTTLDDWPPFDGKAGSETTPCRQWLIERACRTDADCGGQTADSNIWDRDNPLAGRVCDHRYEFTTKCFGDMTDAEREWGLQEHTTHVQTTNTQQHVSRV